MSCLLIGNALFDRVLEIRKGGSSSSRCDYIFCFLDLPLNHTAFLAFSNCGFHIVAVVGEHFLGERRLERPLGHSGMTGRDGWISGSIFLRLLSCHVESSSRGHRR